VDKARLFVPLLVAAGGGGLGSGRTAKNEGIQHGHGANSSREPVAGIGFGDSPAGRRAVVAKPIGASHKTT